MTRNVAGADVAKALADWCLGLRIDEIPDDVLAKAEDCIIDAIASAIPGQDVEGARRIHAVANTTYRQGDAAIWFSHQRLHRTGAAFANAASASILDIDDGHRMALGHPGAAVVPAALAAAAETGTTGEELLIAVIVGYEACIRIGRAERRKAYHTGNWSGFGACAATAMLAGLNTQQLTHALAITAYHGPRVADLTLSTDMGSNVKESIPWSVVAGMTAVDLAVEGFTGCRDALDIEERFEPAAALEGLGQGFLITRTYFKHYSACRWIHSSVEALLEIMQEHGISPDQVEEVRVETFHQAASLNNHADPHSLESAQYSIPYCLGLAATLGESALMPVSAANLHNDAAVAFAGKVKVAHKTEMDPAFPANVPAHVFIRTERGTFDSHLLLPWGEPDRAPARGELVAKFQALAEGRIHSKQVDEIVAASEGLRDGTVASLLSALQASAPVGAIAEGTTAPITVSGEAL